jgi:SpoVK/Ycf46/Vps4 family AAA+-type ATPase
MRDIGAKANYIYLNQDVVESLDVNTKTLLTILSKKFDPSRVEALRKKGIEPRFNLLFTGIPGAGKTYLAAIIAKTLSRPIYKTNGRCLADLMHNLREPSVIVIEDADANGAQQRGFSKDDEGIGDMLQVLDGTRLGHLFIFTTNYPDRLDVAVLRSERFSMRLMFGYASREAKVYILRRYFGEYPNIGTNKAWSCVYSRIKRLDLTNAQLTSFCSALHAREIMPTQADYDALEVHIKEFATRWKCSLVGINIATN